MTNKNSKKMIQAALGLPVNGRGEFLVTLRNHPGAQKLHSKWQVAGGGIEFGETPQQAMRRELEEELGVTKIKILHPDPIIKLQLWHHKNFSSHILLLCYLVDINNQEISLNHEGLEYRWASPAQLPSQDCLPLTLELLIEASKIITNNNLISKLS